MPLRSRIRAALPDEPIWVETRDLLAFSGSEVRGSPGAFVVWSAADKLGSVVGLPRGDDIVSAAVDCGELLAFPGNIDGVLASLPGWNHVHATILTRSGAAEAPSHPTGTIPIDRIVALDVPADLQSELLDAADDGCDIIAAFDGDAPVAFAYAASETETLFDVSIDTLASHRRQGFAKAAASRLINDMTARGKAAVWGAADDNPASLQLAIALGFETVDQLFVLTPPETRGAGPTGR